jgi:glycosyltransferase involved in cell wall biosynthesis
MKPVLFISHDAGRTGAPMVLLHLCRWLAGHQSRPMEFVLGDGGDLEADFAALGPVVTIGRLADPSRARARAEAVRERVARREFALLYANTVESADLLEMCGAPATPAVTHVHELDFWIREHTGLDRFSLIRDGSDRFIAVSAAVRDNLVAGHGISADAIDLVHAFIDVGAWSAPADRGQAVRGSLGIPEAAIVVGGAGTLDWRKGADLFVQVAGAVRRLGPGRPVHWVWVGGPAEGRYAAGLRHDAAHLGVAPVVHFVGPQREPAPWFAGFDLFLSTSREDPYPIVNLEAAASGVPVVCFAGAGGAAEFVEDDAGAVVPYLDVAAMARCVLEFAASDSRRSALGAAARDKVRARHDVATAAPQLAAIIDAAIAAGPTPARLARMAAMPPHAATAPSWPLGDDGWIVVYRIASAQALAGSVERARLLFSIVADDARDAQPDLAGKAWFKLATLGVPRDEAIRCCERALELLPTHGAARRMRDALRADGSADA